ncbi:hypothetical protein Amir_1902 [Actinosynnema mirum DSM 43827]|uniref:Uncharacterized protein n=1 Tax=Actinosynnema mirum (strain ATCC 29888 / DSM 43827 / JCM 3225 / NBRC 14064 / NCIMB 13271 / NRRL B-12336 / IMRU 3971 / 101) TaxID=446462 RepID=C6WEA7_ACTMD|nr:hypothetical protein Amir_1902 [Actinosynnema mirum DSM 43827]
MVRAVLAAVVANGGQAPLDCPDLHVIAQRDHPQS